MALSVLYQFVFDYSSSNKIPILLLSANCIAMPLESQLVTISVNNNKAEIDTTCLNYNCIFFFIFKSTHT